MNALSFPTLIYLVQNPKTGDLEVHYLLSTAVTVGARKIVAEYSLKRKIEVSAEPSIVAVVH